MSANEEIDRLLDELAQELGEDVHNLERIRTGVRQLQGSIAPHAAVILALTGLTFGESEAAEHWKAVRQRRAEISRALGRPAPLREPS